MEIILLMSLGLLLLGPFHGNSRQRYQDNLSEENKRFIMLKALKQAKEMQAKFQQMQEEIENIEETGQSGGGLVQVTLSGKGNMKGVEIDPSLFKEMDGKLVEDLILAAHNEAKQKIDAAILEKTNAVTGGLSLPPGLLS